MIRKRLPIGIQTFREIREENSYYVDKTQFALDLGETGEVLFSVPPPPFRQESVSGYPERAFRRQPIPVCRAVGRRQPGLVGPLSGDPHQFRRRSDP